MNKFRIVHSLVHAAIAGLCWQAFLHFGLVEKFVASRAGFSLEYAGLAVIAVLALLFRLSDKFSNALIERVPVFSWLLRRGLSGREFIEGDWPLAVVDMANRKLLYLGFLTISYKGGQPYVFGDDWTPQGEHAHSFRSMQARYDRHVLQYWYTQGVSLHEPEMEGYTKIYFFPEGATAERHAGKFLDPKHTSDIRFYAVRQRYGFLARRMTAKEQKLQAARAVWASIYKNLDTLKARKISADFV